MISEKLIWNIKVVLLRAVGSKRVALASFPRSGNTWLRFMIEEATGLPSGSIYSDRVLPRGSKGIVIKTHEMDSFRYTHAIHLVRNPFDAITSFFYWKRDIARERVIWQKHVKESVEKWRLHTEHWLTLKKSVFRIRYEDLRADPHRILGNVLSWMEFDIPEDTIASTVDKARLKHMRRLAPRVGKNFFRKGESGTGIAQFSPSERDFLMARLADLLSKLDYEDGGE